MYMIILSPQYINILQWSSSLLQIEMEMKMKRSFKTTQLSQESQEYITMYITKSHYNT